MYSPLQLAAKYIRYYITAANGRGHGIHSPFVYDFIVQVLNNSTNVDAYTVIEQCRKRLREDNRLLEIQDYGAGSAAGAAKQRRVSAIVRTAAKSAKLGRLLFRVAAHYKPAVMVELGTSLGISGAYLAKGHPSGRLITAEGAPAIAAVAADNFSWLQISNVEIVTGNFDETLPVVLDKLRAVDLAFVDGNHRKEPTLRYFNQLLQKVSGQAVLIFDDIHWSRDMEQAWKEIKDHPQVLLTIDLFFTGLVFFNPGFKVKQHFVIRF